MYYFADSLHLSIIYFFFQDEANIIHTNQRPRVEAWKNVQSEFFSLVLHKAC